MAADRSYGAAPSGFRLPDSAHVGGVRLQVSDLSRSLDYDQHVLGLSVLDRSLNSAMLGAEGSRRELVRLHAKPGIRPAPRAGAFGLYHFAVLLPERAALGRFAAHLSRLHIRAGTADHLVSESFYLTDPDGLGIEVYADRPREMWTTRGREIAMAVDPLDVAGLIAAAGPVAWERAPAATTIGHMHLHVGDLDRAEAFYHSALGFDKTLWSFPGALFLAAGGYHHHLGTNTWSPGPAATDDQARLLEWELVVPDADAAAAVAASLGRAGYAADVTGAGWAASDPWGTRLRIEPARSVS
jgi:catechol 2,3-dioxygenase